MCEGGEVTRAFIGLCARLAWFLLPAIRAGGVKAVVPGAVMNPESKLPWGMRGALWSVGIAGGVSAFLVTVSMFVYVRLGNMPVRGDLHTAVFLEEGEIGIAYRYPRPWCGPHFYDLKHRPSFSSADCVYRFRYMEAEKVSRGWYCVIPLAGITLVLLVTLLLLACGAVRMRRAAVLVTLGECQE